MCVPTPNHRKLLEDCYPPSKRIAGVESPSSNELGKLVYYAQRKPAKLTKVGKLLEDRAAADARAMAGTGAAKEKARCGLLITIAILKALITECPRDITYMSKSAQAIMFHVVKASATSGNDGQRDLNLSARSSSTFFAFTCALDPARNSVDGELGKTYLDLLDCFSHLATDRTSPDQEEQNRARLIGLAALSAAASSDVLYTSAFSRQASIIIPALLEVVQAKSAPLDDLKAEVQKVVTGAPSYDVFSSLARKKPSHRKTPSLSGHVVGEKGPESAEVISAAMGILHGLFKDADALQVQEATKAVLTWMDGGSGSQPQWENDEWARFLGTTLVRWTALQYRFVILNSLLEYLVDDCEGPPQFKHITLLEMIAAILSSKDITLIGLSTSDALNNLAGLTIRRVHFDIKDPLLSQLVRCIEVLAIHIYYADQLSDAAEELVARITALSQPDSDTSAAKATTRVSHLPIKSAAAVRTDEAQKVESIRILLFALMRLIMVANSNEVIMDKTQGRDKSNSESFGYEKGEISSSLAISGISLAETRSRIQPDILQPLTWLLASFDCGVRLSAAQLFLAYLKLEAQEPSAASSESASFVHGISAAAHVCALSRSLRIPSPAPAGALENPLGHLVLIQRANEAGSVTLKDESEAGVPLDYSALVAVFTSATDRLAGAALLALVPALLAIDKAAARALAAEDHSPSLITQRRQTARIFLAKAWIAISEKWSVPSLRKEAEAVLAAFNDDILPTVPEPPKSLTPPGEVDLFPEYEGDASAGEGRAAASPVFNHRRIMEGLARSAEVQTNTGMPEEALLRWFGRDWNVEMAIDDSIVGASPYHDPSLEAALGNGGADKATRLTFDKMNGNGAALTNASRGGETGTGVDDFRQALGSGLIHGGGGAGRSIKTNRSSLQDPSSAVRGIQGLDLPIPGLRSSPSAKSISGFTSSKSRVLNNSSLAVDAVSISESFASASPSGGPMSASERRANRRAGRQANPRGQAVGGPEASKVVIGNGNSNGTTNGTGLNGVGVAGLLEKLGIPDSPSESGGLESVKAPAPAMVPPHAA